MVGIYDDLYPVIYDFTFNKRHGCNHKNSIGHYHNKNVLNFLLLS